MYGRLRVLHVIPSVSRARGGPSEAIRGITNGLAQAGVEITIATTDDDGEGQCVPSREGFADDVKMEWFPRTSFWYTVSTELRRWLKRETARFDVVHVHSLFSFPATVGAWCAMRARVPYVVRPLGTLNQWGLTQRRPALKRVSLALVERDILRRAAWIHYCSESEQREAAPLAGGFAARVIANPVWLPAEVERKAGEPVILSLSRIDDVKRIDHIIAAWKTLRAEFPGLGLRVAGSGAPQLVGKLRDLAGPGAEFPGAVSGAQKEQEFARATAFVLASESENFGISAAEAMARAVPVVVSQGVAIHGEIAAARAGMVAEDGAEGIAAALRSILRNPAESKEMGARGRALARERFSAEAVAETLRREYLALARA